MPRIVALFVFVTALSAEAQEESAELRVADRSFSAEEVRTAEAILRWKYGERPELRDGALAYLAECVLLAALLERIVLPACFALARWTGQAGDDRIVEFLRLPKRGAEEHFLEFARASKVWTPDPERTRRVLRIVLKENR